MTYLEKLAKRLNGKATGLCVGLDPRLERHADINAMGDFLREILSVTAAHAAVYKPNIAYFEALGSRGIKLLEDILSEIPPEIPVVLDCKRGDIGETQKYYAKACFDQWNVDAVTLNPFLGRDTLEPFFAYADKGFYLLAVTSNPGSADIQQLKSDGRHVFEHVCDMTAGHPAAGLVVGLTNAAEELLQKIPDVPLLIPGLGAQGGDLQALTAQKRGAPILVNVSRGILYPDSNFTIAQATQHYADQIAKLS